MNKIAKLLVLFVVLLLLNFVLSAQSISSDEELIKAITSDTSRADFEFVVEKGSSNNDWRSNFKQIDGRVVIDRALNIVLVKNNSVANDHVHLFFDKFHFTNYVRFLFKNDRLSIDFTNSIFEKGVDISGNCNQLFLFKNKISDYVFVEVESEDDQRGGVSIKQNEFIATKKDTTTTLSHWTRFGQIDHTYESAFFDTAKIYNNIIFEDAEFIFRAKVRQFIFDRNTFNSFTHITSNIWDRAYIEQNIFNSEVIFDGELKCDLHLRGNTFNGLASVETLVYPLSSEIEWLSLISNLAVKRDTLLKLENIPIKYWVDLPDSGTTEKVFSSTLSLSYLYNGDTENALFNSVAFKELNYSYKTLFDNFKEKGDVDFANRIFVEVKDLEGKRLKAVYQRDGGFRNLFAYLLNRLMKFYTNHATDPALALVVSFYMVIAFGIFYFFFPSEWDVESKGKIVGHFKDFIKKNEKGYFKPFAFMIGGLAVSLANAFALSLNSFVTLGFGNIPTSGIARYVCIIQGFLGWFLLSIFTVALFNQVLF